MLVGAPGILYRTERISGVNWSDFRWSELAFEQPPASDQLPEGPGGRLNGPFEDRPELTNQRGTHGGDARRRAPDALDRGDAEVADAAWVDQREVLEQGADVEREAMHRHAVGDGDADRR